VFLLPLGHLFLPSSAADVDDGVVWDAVKMTRRLRIPPLRSAFVSAKRKPMCIRGALQPITGCRHTAGDATGWIMLFRFHGI